MKTRFLFPYWCKYLGIVLFLVHLPAVLFFKPTIFLKNQPDIVNHSNDASILGAPHLFFLTTIVLMLTGLVLFAFSKEKIEDEQISQLRLDSLQWAVYLSYILLIIGLAFSNHQDAKDLIHMNVWVPLVIFIALFRWKMFRNSRYTKEA